MGKFNKILFTLIALLIANMGFAQDVEMADTMRSNGKIYVVVAVLTTVFLRLAAYLFLLDRRISKLEKK